MIWIKNKIIPFKGFNAITIWPFVFYKKDSKTMRNHEKIHLVQQAETLLVSISFIFISTAIFSFKWWYLSFFLLYYVIYLIEWLIRLLFNKGMNAYYGISFEQEAYDNQYNDNYLKNSRFFAWVKYLKKYS